MVSQAEMKLPDGWHTLTPRIVTNDVAALVEFSNNADATYKRAVDAGAKSLEAPLDTPYGDRRAMVEDRWGNVWQIATFRG